MAIAGTGLTSTCQIEIFSPEREDAQTVSKTCLCCEQPRPASCLDEDGRGICEECLSP